MIKIITIILILGLILTGSPYLASTVYKSKIQFYSSINLIQDHLFIILIFNMAFYLFEILRFKLFANILNIKLSFIDSFNSIAVNLFFGWLTPSAFLGAPASAYYLYKRGISLHEALIISFIRSFTIILTSSLTTIIIFASNLQGSSHNPEYRDLMLKILIGLALYIGTLILICFLPEKWLIKIPTIFKTTQKLKLFFKNGIKFFPLVLGLSLATNFLLVGFIFYLGLNYTNNVTELVSQTYLFLSYLLLAPSPGATGLAEIGGPLFFSQSIPLDQIVSGISSMRISTFLFQMVIGLVTIVFIIKKPFDLETLKAFKDKSTKNS